MGLGPSTKNRRFLCIKDLVELIGKQVLGSAPIAQERFTIRITVMRANSETRTRRMREGRFFGFRSGRVCSLLAAGTSRAVRYGAVPYTGFCRSRDKPGTNARNSIS